MAEFEDLEPRWVDWITQVGMSLDIEVDQVDIAAIHRLTGEIAARSERPLAPVGALLMGFALATHGSMTPEEVRALILASLPSTEKPRG